MGRGGARVFGGFFGSAGHGAGGAGTWAAQRRARGSGDLGSAMLGEGFGGAVLAGVRRRSLFACGGKNVRAGPG